jgi:hypothetical protein
MILFAPDPSKDMKDKGTTGLWYMETFIIFTKNHKQALLCLALQ